MKLTLIRHSKTIQDNNISSLLWQLSDEGKSFALELSKIKIIGNINILYSSLQTKALQTANILAENNNIPIRTDDGLTELSSITNGFIPDYQSQIKALYYGEILRINNGETLDEGLFRFNNAIKDIVNNNKDLENIGIVSHCNILALFSAQFINHKAYTIHNLMNMPDTAVLDWDKKEFIKFFGNKK